MDKKTKEKLALSLTAESTELLPYLPYLLQDLWLLGSTPEDMIRLIKKHIVGSRQLKILDLACGKGAVAIKTAQAFGSKVTGYDIISEFIDHAIEKAMEHQVENLCRFLHGDIQEIVNQEVGYDCVILGAAGNILGNMYETLNKLKRTIKDNGFILIDDAYLITSNENIKYKNYEYHTYDELVDIFIGCNLNLLEVVTNENNNNKDKDNTAIQQRAAELSVQYPDKKSLFEAYVQSQLNECDDLEHHIVGATFLLQNR